MCVTAYIASLTHVLLVQCPHQFARCVADNGKLGGTCGLVSLFNGLICSLQEGHCLLLMHQGYPI